LPASEARTDTSVEADPQHLQHILGACFGAVALGIVVATVLGVWLDAPGGPVRINDPRALVRGGCAMPESDSAHTDYVGVPCDDPRATVLVLDVTDPVESGPGEPRCPLGTDRLIEIYTPPLSQASPSPQRSDDEAGEEPTEEPQVTDIGCVRNLYPPHPGDPGAGEGQLVAGDCGYLTGDRMVAEAPCAGEADDPKPRFQVLGIYADPIDCPEGTTEKYKMWPDLDFDDDGFLMVCAVPYRNDGQ
jgi:hypothetical protein